MLITSSVYSSITNNQGTCSFNIESISEDTTYVASYEDLSATVEVGIWTYYDKGTDTDYNHNTYVYRLANRSENGTKIGGTYRSNLGYLSPSTNGTNSSPFTFNGDFFIEFDVTSEEKGNFNIAIYDSDKDPRLFLDIPYEYQNSHIRAEYNNTTKTIIVYSNGLEIGRSVKPTIDDLPKSFNLGLYSDVVITKYCTIKNLGVKEI